MAPLSGPLPGLGCSEWRIAVRAEHQRDCLALARLQRLRVAREVVPELRQAEVVRAMVTHDGGALDARRALPIRDLAQPEIAAAVPLSHALPVGQELTVRKLKPSHVARPIYPDE